MQDFALLMPREVLRYFPNLFRLVFRPRRFLADAEPSGGAPGIAVARALVFAVVSFALECLARYEAVAQSVTGQPMLLRYYAMLVLDTAVAFTLLWLCVLGVTRLAKGRAPAAWLATVYGYAWGTATILALVGGGVAALFMASNTVAAHFALAGAQLLVAVLFTGSVLAAWGFAVWRTVGAANGWGAGRCVTSYAAVLLLLVPVSFVNFVVAELTLPSEVASPLEPFWRRQGAEDRHTGIGFPGGPGA